MSWITKCWPPRDVHLTAFCAKFRCFAEDLIILFLSRLFDVNGAHIEEKQDAPLMNEHHRRLLRERRKGDPLIRQELPSPETSLLPLRLELEEVCLLASVPKRHSPEVKFLPPIEPVDEVTGPFPGDGFCALPS